MSNKKHNNNPVLTTKEKYITEVNKVFREKNNIKAQEKVSPIDEVKKKWDMNEKILELFAENIKQDQELRSKYAKILIVILIIELLALLGIFILGGRGTLKYSDATFNIFVSGGIAEIFVLIRVIVQYLFNDNLTEALKIIVTNNNDSSNKEDNKENDNK